MKSRSWFEFRQPVFVGLVVALVAVSCGDDTRRVAVEAPSAEGDSVIGRDDPATAWTGSTLFVYGGRELGVSQAPPLPGAALVNPTSGAEEAVPDPPFELPLEEHAAAVAVGDEVFVMGIQCGQLLPDESSMCEPGTYAAAVYSLGDEAWRSVSLPEELAGLENYSTDVVGVASDGRIVLDLWSYGQRDPADAPFWSFDPRTETWSQLPSPGLRIEDACVVADRVVALSGDALSGGELVAGPDEAGTGATTSNPVLGSLDLTAEASDWNQSVAAPEVEYNVSPRVACGSDSVLVYGLLGEFPLLYDISAAEESWREVPALPEGLAVEDVLWSGEEYLMIDGTAGEGLAFSPSADRWRQFDAPTGQDPVWTGNEIVAWDPLSPTGATVTSLS